MNKRKTTLLLLPTNKLRPNRKPSPANRRRKNCITRSTLESRLRDRVLPVLTCLLRHRLRANPLDLCIRGSLATCTVERAGKRCLEMLCVHLVHLCKVVHIRRKPSSLRRLRRASRRFQNRRDIFKACSVCSAIPPSTKVTRFFGSTRSVRPCKQNRSRLSPANMARTAFGASVVSTLRFLLTELRRVIR